METLSKPFGYNTGVNPHWKCAKREHHSFGELKGCRMLVLHVAVYYMNLIRYIFLHQEDNEIPIHLKGGVSDAILYRTTKALTILGEYRWTPWQTNPCRHKILV